MSGATWPDDSTRAQMLEMEQLDLVFSLLGVSPAFVRLSRYISVFSFGWGCLSEPDMLEGWNLFYCTEFTDRKSPGSQRSLHFWIVWNEKDCGDF